MQHVHNLDGCAAIEIAGGLIREKKGRLIHQRPGDRDTLLLSSRKLGREVQHSLAEANEFERVLRSRLAFGPTDVRIESGQFHVLKGRCSRQQVKTLKHKPDFLIANVRELVL